MVTLISSKDELVGTTFKVDLKYSGVALAVLDAGIKVALSGNVIGGGWKDNSVVVEGP